MSNTEAGRDAALNKPREESRHALGGLIKQCFFVLKDGGLCWKHQGKGRKTAADSVPADHWHCEFLARSPVAPKSPRFTGQIIWSTQLLYFSPIVWRQHNCNFVLEYNIKGSRCKKRLGFIFQSCGPHSFKDLYFSGCCTYMTRATELICNIFAYE